MFRQELEVNSLKSTPRQIQVSFEFAYIFEFFAQLSLVSLALTEEQIMGEGPHSQAAPVFCFYQFKHASL